VPACCPRNRATHSALPQVRPEPRRRLPHGQAGSRRASHAAYASSSAVPPWPGTETTGRMRPPGRASHSRGLSAAGLPGIGPIDQSSLLRNPPDPFPRGAGERLHDPAGAAGICSADHPPDRVDDRAAAQGPGQRRLAGADLGHRSSLLCSEPATRRLACGAPPRDLMHIINGDMTLRAGPSSAPPQVSEPTAITLAAELPSNAPQGQGRSPVQRSKYARDLVELWGFELLASDRKITASATARQRT
jgi:hypothetical protein